MSASHAAIALGGSAHSSSEDEAVRSYLRALVGAPVRTADRVAKAESSFVESAASWATRSGVDRRTLARLGVPRRVLEAAGLRPTPVGDLVRRQYETGPFTASALVRKSGVSATTVRGVLKEDVEAGRLERIEAAGRMVLYRLP